MHKSKVIIVLAFLTAFYDYSTSWSQSNSLEYQFRVINDSIGVFELWNSTNSTFLVGKVEFHGDTLYFHEFQDTVVLRSSVHGVNTTVENQKIGVPSYVQKNQIASKFYYLGNKNKLVHFSQFDYGIDDELVFSYRNDDVRDTLHYLDFTPDRYEHFELANNGKLLSTIRVNLRNPGGKRKGSKHLEEEILDFWLFEFDVYYSDNSPAIDIHDMTNGVVNLGNRLYILKSE